MNLGEKITTRRKQLKMTQVELAKKLHTTKQTIGKYEKGIVTNLPLNRIQELADALECDPEYLTGWINDIEKPAENIISGLSDEERILIDLFRKLPEDQHQYFLLQLRAIAEAQK